jgi:DNA (cytosine-5)-methyltransferase 1
VQTSVSAGAAVGRTFTPLNDGNAERHKRTISRALALVGGSESTIAPAYALAPLPTPQDCEWNATSLFSGGGGLDLGFVAEGVRIDAAYDNWRPALLCHGAALPGAARIADLHRFTPPERSAILLAGAPCQGFSTVGRRDIEDPRNALLRRVADVALATSPTVVVVENVPAALSGRHGRHWIALEDRLRLNGYNVRRMLMSGEDSGIPQRRRRLFMLAWRGSDCIRVELEKDVAPSLRSCLAGVEGRLNHDPRWPERHSLDARIAARIGAGQKLSNVRSSERAIPTWEIPEVFGPTSAEERAILRAVSVLRRRARRRSFGDGDPVDLEVLAAEVGFEAQLAVARLVDANYLRWIGGRVELRHTYNGKYRRLSWHEASPTVDTHFGRPALFLHPDQDRGLSAREAARIQGFADAYRLPVGRAEAFEIIGNAVPPPMAARLAAFVREALLKAA